MLILQYSTVNITKGLFMDNHVDQRGSVIYGSNNGIQSYIDDSIFIDNEVYELGTIYLIETLMTITSSRFSNNKSITSSPGLVLTMSSLF